MTVPADNDDKWLHRLIFRQELTDSNQIHPAAWERFKPDIRVPQFAYVLSGTSWKLGRKAFLGSAAAVVAELKQSRKNPDKFEYCGLIYQLVQIIRKNAGPLALDVYVVRNDPKNPAHAILVTTKQLLEKDGSISPDVANQLNQLFCLALPGSPEEHQALDP